MRQFDIVTYNEVAVVVIESDDLPTDARVVVIPIEMDEGYPAVPRFNPRIEFGETSGILATRLVISVNRAVLRPTGYNVEDHRDAIVRAIDILMGAY